MISNMADTVLIFQFDFQDYSGNSQPEFQNILNPQNIIISIQSIECISLY